MEEAHRKATFMSRGKVSQLTKRAARLSVCLPFRLSVCNVSALPLCSVPDDLSPEERQELECIRRRKEELLLDIQVTSHQVFSCYTRVIGIKR